MNNINHLPTIPISKARHNAVDDLLSANHNRIEVASTVNYTLMKFFFSILLSLLNLHFTHESAEKYATVLPLGGELNSLDQPYLPHSCHSANGSTINVDCAKVPWTSGRI